MAHFTRTGLAFPSSPASVRPEPLLSVLSEGTSCPGPGRLCPHDSSPPPPPPSSYLHSLPLSSTARGPSSVTTFTSFSPVISPFISSCPRGPFILSAPHKPHSGLLAFPASHLLSFFSPSLHSLQYLSASIPYFYLLFLLNIVPFLFPEILWLLHTVRFYFFLPLHSFVGPALLKHLLCSRQCAKR